MRQFVSMKEAFEAIEKYASQRLMKTSTIPLPNAVGQVLAEPAVAQLSIPPFNNSARDGVVLSSTGVDAAKCGDEITLAGELRAGDSTDTANGLDGMAARIMTGAPVPDWGAAIVMIEDVEFSDDTSFTASAIPEKGAWIRPEGSDITAGSMILKPGCRIVPEHVQGIGIEWGRGGNCSRAATSWYLFNR